MFNKWGLKVLGSGPKIWGQEFVGVCKSIKASFDEILRSTSVTTRCCVNIINTCKLQDFLGDWGSDDTCTTGSWGQLESD
jgi:hypothetical protein